MSVQPLYTLLPYESYDPDRYLYFNKQSVGFVLNALPLVGTNESIIQILHNLIVDTLPDETTLDILLWASPKISPYLTSAAQLQSTRGGIYERLALHRQAYLEKGAYYPLVNGHVYIRDFQLRIAISLPSIDSKKHDWSLICDQVTSAFRSVGITVSLLAADSLLNYLYDVLHPELNSYPAQIIWNPYTTFSRQCCDQSHCYKVFPGHLEVGDHQIISLYPTRYPEQCQQWAMTDFIGDLYRDTLQIPCPFLLKLSVRVLNRGQAERRAMFKQARASQLAQNRLASFMPKLKKIHDDWQFVQERLSAGDRLVQLIFQVVLYPKKDKAASAENSVKNLFQSKGWKLVKPKLIQFPFFLASLPMAMGDGLWRDMYYFNLTQTKLGFNAVNMAPLQGEWKGLKNPLMTLLGRRGQIIHWDPFDHSAGNYNVAVAGKSGSGKSVFLQEFETRIAGSGGRVFVIDVGHSSEKLCKLLQGEFIEFHPNTQLSLNPFTHIKDFKESLGMLKPLLALMAAPTRQITDFENAFLEKALNGAWTISGNQSEISDVADWLCAQVDQRAKDLGTMLFPYTASGGYGRFFTGPCTLNFDSHFINLELEGLKAKKELQEVVLCFLMYHITEVMYRSDRQKRIVCVIDEAWDIFRGAIGGEFVETGYRRARKYQCAFVSGTQGVNDYYKNLATRAAFENSDWLCLLSQKPESIQQLKKSERLMINEQMERLLNSLKTIQGVFSEIFIQGPMGYAVGRLVLDKFSQWLYSSKGEEFAQIKQLIEKGLSINEAIEQLSGESL
jgi:conjugal transfer ATP-binding protein TraC